MKNLLLLPLLFLFLACKTTNSNQSTNSESNVQISAVDYETTINAEALKEHLFIIASDEMEGRKTGEPGQKKAAEYIKQFYLENNIKSPLGKDDFFQEVPSDFFREGSGIKDSENIIAFVEGSEKPNEVVIVTAHYDHVGIDKDGNIFNGADDDGSGTVALMLMAKAFQKAKNDGNGPKRSIAFLHVTGEEIGLVGSRFYTENPIFPLENTIANLNIDMIGRIDPNKKETPEYIYLIGSDKLSQELHQVSETVNNTFVNLELDYTFNADNDPNRFYYRSDHYNFAKNNIPVIFYFSGVHEDYHKITDTADKIEYKLYEKRARLVFHTAWELANRKDRVALDITK
ncbi:M28 family metallopeptidase [uncultured Planktosalinus sp.]|uniref:M28 family metallopeptidase n=1 Tax=uncultured Planktosalinus sp. TaxID=1810935 RepID=UPI0030DD4CD6